jgi:hypothetical protein
MFQTTNQKLTSSSIVITDIEIEQLFEIGFEIDVQNFSSCVFLFVL